MRINGARSWLLFRLAGPVFVICWMACASPAWADDHPVLNLRMVDHQVQVGVNSARPYYVEWYSPSGIWQPWLQGMEVSSAMGTMWLRGIFQPDDATCWDLPEESESLLISMADDEPSDGWLWNTLARQNSDGSMSGITRPSFGDILDGATPGGDSLPSAIDARANLIWHNPSGRMVVEWILDTGGSLQSAFVVTNMSSGAYLPAGMGDVNRDGISDLFLYESNLRKVAVWMLDDDGRYQSSIICNEGIPMLAGWLLRAIGDIDRDGTADIVWHGSSNRMAAYWLLETNGSLKSYGLCTNIVMSTGWSLNGSGDIDGDGTMDLLWHNSLTKRVAYWFLNSNGTLRSFGFCTTNTMSNGWEMRGSGDIKGDGTIGVLWHNSISKRVAYWLLDTNGILDSSGFSYGSAMSGGWELKATVDINSDRTMDAVWFNTQTRKTAYWLMNADGTVGSSGFCTNVAVASGYTLYAAGLCEPSGEPENVWTEVAGLPLGITMAGAETLGSYIYHVGGFGNMDILTNVYRYNGTSFAEANSLSAMLDEHGLCNYSGNLYAIGGIGWGFQFQTNVYRFDGTNWTEVAGLPAAISPAGTAALRDRMYSIGGKGVGGEARTNVYQYDGANWTEVAGLPSARKDAGAATLGDYIYVAGGRDPMNLYATNVFRYDGTNWTEAASLPGPCSILTLTALNGALYAVGGEDGIGIRTNVYMFTGASWIEVAGLPQPRRDHAAAALGGYLYVMGGDNMGDPVTNVYRYTPGLIVGDHGEIVLPTFETTPPEGGTPWEDTIDLPEGGVPEDDPENPGTFDPSGTGDDQPAAIAGRASLIWHNPTGRIVHEWILNTTGTTQDTFMVTNMSSGAYLPAGMGDVDGDGISDLFLYDSTQRKVAVWLLDANGRYQSAIICNAGNQMSAGWLLRAIGDIDQDGTADIVWHNSTTRKAAYWLLESSGALKSFDLCTNLAMSVGWSLDGSGDMDGDGTMDLLWYNSTTRRVAYWFLNSDGSLREAGFCTTNTMASAWQMRGVGDIKGDGTMAILWHNSSSKLVAYWFLNTDGTLESSGLAYGGTMAGGWELKATVDINDDNTMDAIWFNTTTRKTAYWLMNTDGTMASSGFCSPTTVAAGYTLYTAGICQPGSGPENVWVEVAGLPTAVRSAGADVLGSSIYHVGGIVNGLDATNVYRFDGTNWAAVAGLPDECSCHAVCSYDGNLYTMGGWENASTRGTNVFAFNGTTWSEVAGLPNGVIYPAAAAWGEHLYVIGGQGDSASLANVYRYDGTSWTEVAGLPHGRYGAAAASMGGALYVAGGNDDATIMAATNVYRFDGSSWAEVAGLPAAREFLTMQYLNGALYAMGGHDENLITCTNVFMFDGSNWTEVEGLPQPRRLHSAAVLDGKLYAMGGYDDGSVTNVYRYTPDPIVADSPGDSE